MAMSRKDYVTTAAIIAEQSEANVDARGVLRGVADDLARMFVKDNSRFNRSTFLAACGFDSNARAGAL